MRAVWLLAGLLVASGVFLYVNPVYRAQAVDSVSRAISPATVSRAYKWRNAGGEWQLSDTPPPAGLPYEVLEHRSDENVLPRPPQPDQRD